MAGKKQVDLSKRLSHGKQVYSLSFVKGGEFNPLFLISFVSSNVNPSATFFTSFGYIGAQGFHSMRGITGFCFGS